MEIYVVSCYMEGCEECGNETHIVGVYKNKERADKEARKHEKNSVFPAYGRTYENLGKYEHLHDCICTVTPCKIED